MNNLYNQLQEVKRKYNLNYIIGEKNSIIFGNLDINHKYNNILMSGTFYTYISIDNNFPNTIPIVKDPKNMVIDFHKNSNTELCLGCTVELLLKIKVTYKNKITIADFIERIIIPFYYSYLFFKKYKKTPYGERSHGGLGIIEYYKELFKVENSSVAFYILKYLSTKEYKGHHFCPCCSGKIIRNCHKNTMILLLENVGKTNISKDYSLICEEMKYIKRQERKKRFLEYKRKQQQKKRNYYFSKENNKNTLCSLLNFEFVNTKYEVIKDGNVVSISNKTD